MKTKYSQEAPGCGPLCKDHAQLNSDIHQYYAVQNCLRSIHLITESLTLLTNLSNIALFPTTPNTQQPLLVTCAYEFIFILLYCACVRSHVHIYVQICGDQE